MAKTREEKALFLWAGDLSISKELSGADMRCAEQTVIKSRCAHERSPRLTTLPVTLETIRVHGSLQNISKVTTTMRANVYPAQLSPRAVFLEWLMHQKDSSH